MTKPDVEILPSAYGRSFPLAWVAGYVDAVGFLTLAGLFVAHMSGNTVRLGVFIGDGDWSFAVQRFVPIVVFVLGVVGGIALVEALQRRSTPVPARVLSIEAALLLVFMLVGRAVLGGHSRARRFVGLLPPRRGRGPGDGIAERRAARAASPAFRSTRRSSPGC